MLVIRFPKNTEEFFHGIGLVKKVYTERFRTYPREFPHYFLLAFDTTDNQIVGTLNIQIKEENLPLEVERYFYFDIKKIFADERVGESGRFTAIRNGVSTHLFAAAIQFGIKFGIDRYISFNKGYITKILTELLEKPPEIHRPKLQRENIPKDYHNFFLSREDPVHVLSWKLKNYQEHIQALISTVKIDVSIELPETLEDQKALIETVHSEPYIFENTI